MIAHAIIRMVFILSQALRAEKTSTLVVVLPTPWTILCRTVLSHQTRISTMSDSITGFLQKLHAVRGKRSLKLIEMHRITFLSRTITIVNSTMLLKKLLHS